MQKTLIQRIIYMAAIASLLSACVIKPAGHTGESLGKVVSITDAETMAQNASRKFPVSGAPYAATMQISGSKKIYEVQDKNGNIVATKAPYALTVGRCVVVWRPAMTSVPKFVYLPNGRASKSNKCDW